MHTLYEKPDGSIKFTSAPDFNPYGLKNSGCPVFHVMEKRGDKWAKVNTIDMHNLEYAKTIY